MTSPAPQSSARKIYVASSWRNDQQQHVVAALRTAGHEVYDFKNPAPGKTGFSWRKIVPEPPPWSAEKTREVLAHEISKEGFGLDFDAMQWADTILMVQPCGRSAALELGWGCGAEKLTVVLLADGQEPELMLKCADMLCTSLEEVIEFLKTEDAAEMAGALAAREARETRNAFAHDAFHSLLAERAEFAARHDLAPPPPGSEASAIFERLRAVEAERDAAMQQRARLALALGSREKQFEELVRARVDLARHEAERKAFAIDRGEVERLRVAADAQMRDERDGCALLAEAMGAPEIAEKIRQRDETKTKAATSAEHDDRRATEKAELLLEYLNNQGIAHRGIGRDGGCLTVHADGGPATDARIPSTWGGLRVRVRPSG